MRAALECPPRPDPREELYEPRRQNLTDKSPIKICTNFVRAPRPIPHTEFGEIAGGTAGDFTEFRVWNRTRSPDEIRADFDRTFVGEVLPSGLVQFFPGVGPWGTLKGGAHVVKVAESPNLLPS